MKIVVLGGNGFIGKHLVSKLSVTNAKDEIVVFDRIRTNDTESASFFNEIANVTLVPGDFFNSSDVANVLTGADYVFHLVSTTNPAASNNNPLIDIDTNIRASVELFQRCVDKGVKKVLFPSSGGTVYGDIDSLTISEGALPEPFSPYGIGKLTIEHYLRYFKRSHGLDYCIYRVANPFGPGQNVLGKQGVIPIFMYRLLTNQPIEIYGDGSMTRDYIYVEDLVNMIATTFEKNNKHDVYNLGSGSGTTVNELVKSIETRSGKTFEKVSKDTPSTYTKNSVLNIDRFIEEFSVEPKTSLDDGIEKTWEYVRGLDI